MNTTTIPLACGDCGTALAPGRRGPVKRYCARCRHRHRPSRDTARPQRLECAVCGTAFIAAGRRYTCGQTVCASEHRRRWRRSRSIRRRSLLKRQCLHCGFAFAPVRYRWHCSAACHAKRVGRKKGAGSQRRRKERANGRLDKRGVLVRDGWRCQMCGIETPMGLRGTFAPNAPEVDHIVPLALGGADTADNARCACRSCNNKKGASLQSEAA